jgi:cytochrome c biogenesis protein CcmG/thiol:disulfide interchange protein DsbE
MAYVALSLAVLSPALEGQQDAHAKVVASARRKPAPVFQLMDASGKSFQVSDYLGEVVLLNFWATECGGCLREIPSLIGLQTAYKDQGFAVVGVSADILYSNLKSPEAGWGQVNPFVASHHMNYPILMADDPVLIAYSAKSIPATFLIDKSGRIAATYVGIVNKDNIEANVKALLAEQPQ